MAPQLERLRAHFGAHPGARYVDHDEIAASSVFRIHLDTFSGRPTEEELGLLRWRDGGAIWFLPSTPMRGSVALEHQALSRRILGEHGFEYVVELVCGPRAARALHLLLFDRGDPEQCRRARECYAALLAAYDAAGYPAARMPTEFQEPAMARMPLLQAVCGDLKGALDPGGVIAPGKYGIAVAFRAVIEASVLVVGGGAIGGVTAARMTGVGAAGDRARRERRARGAPERPRAGLRAGGRRAHACASRR